MMPSSAEHPLVSTVRQFVEREVRPAAPALERADEYPHALVARLGELGLFGALVPATWGGLGLDVTTYARVIEELCRGWMSLAGVINSHTMAALIVLHHGTDEQRARWLPRLACGQARGGLCLTEPQAGSDVQAIRTRAIRRGDEYVMNGTKMFVTNGREGNTFAVLALTDPAAEPRHRGMSCFIVEKGRPGLRVAKSIAKLGYKGVDTAELVFEDFAVSAANLVGGVEGRGFKQVLSGLETGRLNVAARAVGVGQAAFEAAVSHARGAGDAPAALTDMAAHLAAARLLTAWAAGLKDRQQRCDLEAGMAKLWATETAQRLTVAAMRIEGEAAALASSALERLYRDTPLMIIGEGTNEIQRTLIARQLLERAGDRLGVFTASANTDDERGQIVLAIRRFVDKEVVSEAAAHDQASRYPADLIRALSELGILGAVVPQVSGGLGLDLQTYALLVEELARGWTTVAGVVTAHATAASILARSQTSRVVATALPAMTRGDLLGTVALGEGVTARRDGAAWVLSGTTALVDNAPRAQLVVVLARIDDGRRALVVVERDTAGLALGAVEPGLGGRGLDSSRLRFDGVRVSDASLLDTGSGQEASVAAALAFARVGLAATAVGLAQAAFEAALRYSQQRSAFGKPICQHQAIQLKLADMATAIAAARVLTSHAAGRLEAGDDVPAGLARLCASELAQEVALEAMRIHGGYGYTTEFPVERYYRDAARLVLALDGATRDRVELARRLVAAG